MTGRALFRNQADTSSGRAQLKSSCISPDICAGGDRRAPINGVSWQPWSRIINCFFWSANLSHFANVSAIGGDVLGSRSIMFKNYCAGKIRDYPTGVCVSEHGPAEATGAIVSTRRGLVNCVTLCPLDNFRARIRFKFGPAAQRLSWRRILRRRQIGVEGRSCWPLRHR